MVSKRVVGVIILSALSAPASAAKVGDINIDGFAQFEFNGTNNQGPTRQTRFDTFSQFKVAFSGSRELDGDLNFIWRLSNRPRNGNFGDPNSGGATGALGLREAWGGIEGSFGTVKFGRLETKIWEPLDWPYASPASQTELFAETGAAHWVSTRSIRYSSPVYGGFNYEFTYDVGQKDENANARNGEIYLHYVTGGLALDFVHNRTLDAALTVGSNNIFGYNDGQPARVDGNWQASTFLGGRYTFSNGIEAILGYKKNQWHSDGGVSGLSDSWRGKKAPTAGQDVKSSDLLLGVNYPYDKWLIGASAILWLGGKDSTLGDLNDEAKTYSIKFQREVARLTWLYVFMRYAKLDGDFNPIETEGHWQINGVDAANTKNTTRICIGGFLMF
jgi:predicted porin